MNETGPRVEFDIEALARARLERDAERIDPRPLFRKIQGTLSSPSSPRVPVVAGRRPGSVAWKWAGVAAAAAAALIGVVALFLQNRTALARGEIVVREAQAGSHDAGRSVLPGRGPARVVDGGRTVAGRPAGAPDTPLDPGRSVLGRVGAPEQRWAWGRDDENRFWIAFGPHTAVSMEAGEVPYGLNVYCDLHSLNVEKLLGDVLNRFDVTRETRCR